MRAADLETIRQRLSEGWYTDPDDAAHDLTVLLAEVARLQGLIDRAMLLADEWCNGEYRFRHFGRDLRKVVSGAIRPSPQEKIE